MTIDTKQTKLSSLDCGIIQILGCLFKVTVMGQGGSPSSLSAIHLVTADGSAVSSFTISITHISVSDVCRDLPKLQLNSYNMSCIFSIFIRDCTGCKFVVSCQQFRLRDCQKLDAYLCCTTQPIIESSSGVRLACFNYFYPELAGQFKEAGLSVFNNNWSNIHDFTQDPTEKHYTLLPEDIKVEDIVPLPTGDEFQAMQIDTDPLKSVVPRSLGMRRKTSDESCLLVFFCDGKSQERALSFIDLMRNHHPECVLVQTKELKMLASDAQRVFCSDAYTGVVSKGPVIGLEYNGENVIQLCQEVVVTITHGTTGLVFVSQSRETADQQIENYYNFADMQMGV